MGTLGVQEANSSDQDSPLDDEPVDYEPELSDLQLPSFYSRAAIVTAGLTSLADLEKDLRRGSCSDSLDSIRKLLGARAYASNYKKHHVRGEMPTTRSETANQAYSAKISSARWRYNNSRDALLQLGPTDVDLRKFQEITSEDLRTLHSYLQEDSRGVGQGYASIPWIWRSNLGVDTDEWQINGKVLYIHF